MKRKEKKLMGYELLETDNLIWQFEELIKTLIAMSMPYISQKLFYGIGVAATEMVEDFYSYYILNKERLVERELINNNTLSLLDEIESLTDIVLRTVNSILNFNTNLIYK